MIGVLGGGLSGLSAAYYLLKCCNKVHVFERTSRVGGWIKSTRSPLGPIFEHGPRTIRPKGCPGQNTLSLIDELGLSASILPIKSDHPTAQNRLIYVNKTLYSLPSSFLSLFISKPPFNKPLINAVLKDLQTPKKEVSDESIYNFVERRLGKEIADFAISPLICGVCAGNAREISVKFLMKSLFEAEQAHGSIFKGLFRNILLPKGNPSPKANSVSCEKAKKEKWSVYSLQGGLETLPQTLNKAIQNKGGQITLQSECQKIYFKNDNTVSVTVNDQNYEFKKIVGALPAKSLAPLLQDQHPKLSQELFAIPSVSVVVVNLQYSGKVIKKDAFGFLVPPSEGAQILGVVFDSCCFPCGEDTVVTVMMGGYWFEKLFGTNPKEETLLNIATENIKSILNVHVKPKSYNVSVLRDCIPQYIIGHHERIQRINAYIKEHDLPLLLCGASYDGIGVNDVILSAKNATDITFGKR